MRLDGPTWRGGGSTRRRAGRATSRNDRRRMRWDSAAAFDRGLRRTYSATPSMWRSFGDGSPSVRTAARSLDRISRSFSMQDTLIAPPEASIDASIEAPMDAAPAAEPQWTFVRGGVQWPTAFGILLLHLGALAAFIPSTFSWGAAATLPLLWWITGGLGICLGYHRLLTHRSFKTSKFLEHVFATLGALCWQGGPLHRLFITPTSSAC